MGTYIDVMTAEGEKKRVYVSNNPKTVEITASELGMTAAELASARDRELSRDSDSQNYVTRARGITEEQQKSMLMKAGFSETAATRISSSRTEPTYRTQTEIVNEAETRTQTYKPQTAETIRQIESGELSSTEQAYIVGGEVAFGRAADILAASRQQEAETRRQKIISVYQARVKKDIATHSGLVNAEFGHGLAYIDQSRRAEPDVAILTPPGSMIASELVKVGAPVSPIPIIYTTASKEKLISSGVATGAMLVEAEPKQEYITRAVGTVSAAEKVPWYKKAVVPWYKKAVARIDYVTAKEITGASSWGNFYQQSKQTAEISSRQLWAEGFNTMFDLEPTPLTEFGRQTDYGTMVESAKAGLRYLRDKPEKAIVWGATGAVVTAMTGGAVLAFPATATAIELCTATIGGIYAGTKVYEYRTTTEPKTEFFGKTGVEVLSFGAGAKIGTLGVESFAYIAKTTGRGLKAGVDWIEGKVLEVPKVKTARAPPWKIMRTNELTIYGPSVFKTTFKPRVIGYEPIEVKTMLGRSETPLPTPKERLWFTKGTTKEIQTTITGEVPKNYDPLIEITEKTFERGTITTFQKQGKLSGQDLITRFMSSAEQRPLTSVQQIRIRSMEIVKPKDTSYQRTIGDWWQGDMITTKPAQLSTPTRKAFLEWSTDIIPKVQPIKEQTMMENIIFRAKVETWKFKESIYTKKVQIQKQARGIQWEIKSSGVSRLNTAMFSGKKAQLILSSSRSEGITRSRPILKSSIEPAIELSRSAQMETTKFNIPLVKNSAVQPIEITKVSNIEIMRTAPATMTMATQVEVTRTTPVEIIRTKPMEITKTEPIEITRTTPRTVTKTSPIQLTRTAPVEITRTQPVEITKIQLRPTKRPVPEEPIKPIGEELIELLPELKVPKVNIYKGRVKEKKPKRKYNYAPSLAAVEFNIIGPMPRGKLTGLELRPLKRRR